MNSVKTKLSTVRIQNDPLLYDVLMILSTVAAEEDREQHAVQYRDVLRDALPEHNSFNSLL